MLSVNVVYAVLLAMSIQDLPAGHCAGAKCCLVSMRPGPTTYGAALSCPCSLQCVTMRIQDMQL